MKRIYALLILLGLLLLLGTAGRVDSDQYAEPEDGLPRSTTTAYIGSAAVMMAIGAVGIKAVEKRETYLITERM